MALYFTAAAFSVIAGAQQDVATLIPGHVPHHNTKHHQMHKHRGAYNKDHGLGGYDDDASGIECLDHTLWGRPWKNGKKGGQLTCEEYESNNYCKDGAFTAGNEWMAGEEWKHPEDACCACGGGTKIISNTHANGTNGTKTNATQTKGNATEATDEDDTKEGESKGTGKGKDAPDAAKEPSSLL